MPCSATSVLAGGNVRGWLEGYLFLVRGKLVINAPLVEMAVGVIEELGANIVHPQAVREKLGLVKRPPQ